MAVVGARCFSRLKPARESAIVDSQAVPHLKAGEPAELARMEGGEIAGRLARVLELAEEVGADLVVLGVRGRSADQKRQLGSVSQAVVLDATASVLLVRRA